MDSASKSARLERGFSRRPNLVSEVGVRPEKNAGHGQNSHPYTAIIVDGGSAMT
jgi:hypothetical protein